MSAVNAKFEDQNQSDTNKFLQHFPNMRYVKFVFLLFTHEEMNKLINFQKFFQIQIQKFVLYMKQLF